MIDEPLASDTLFLACTRPALWLGVPMQAALLNGSLAVILIVIVKNPLYLGIGIVTHWAMRLIVSRDYNMFQIIGLWGATKGRSLDDARWGGSSVPPKPSSRARKTSEIRAYV